MVPSDFESEDMLEAIDAPVEPEAREEDDVKKAVPAWILSIVAHGVVLGALALIFVATQVERDEPPLKITAQVAPPPEKQPETERKVTPDDVTLDLEIEVDKPSPISELDIEVTEISREEEMESSIVKGREEAVTDVEMGQTGFQMAIGAGGGAVGMSGRRDGIGKKRRIGEGGGNRQSEAAVNEALRWFKRHQSPNGQWDIDGYPANCTENLKCEPGTEHTGEDGDIAGTGYALLCYLGAGYDHRMPSQYKMTVKHGIDWLMSIQNADGLWGKRNYEHAIATMALAECYAMTLDPALKSSAQKGVDVLLARQNQDPKGGYGLGWDYVGPNNRNDSSVTGWCAMALKSARAGNLNIGNGIEGAKHWLDESWKSANPDFKAKDPYSDVSGFPYTWMTDTGEAKGQPSRACIGALCAVFFGHTAEDPMLNSMANQIMATQVPKAYPTNTYYLYYNTMAMFQVGGDRWKVWNGSVRDLLVGAQRREETCFNGSWDFAGTEFHGHDVGRILSTAYCCLSLEVYYRNDRLLDPRH
jgi:hypothetical protein